MANTQTFIGDGSTTKFYFTFPFFGTADIHVTVNNIPLTSDDFTVYPETSPEPADTEYIGGHIETATAPATGATIKVFRNIELVRHIDYQPTTEPLAHQLNQDFNQCMAALNEMTEKLENTLSLASIPNLADLLSELTAIRESFPNFLTADDLETLNTAVSNLEGAITTLNGYDYIVESQLPTADNNYTWYNKYKTGRIEMGGIYQKSSFSLGSGSTIEVSGITFPKTLAEAPKIVSVADDMTFFNLHVIERTTTSIKIKISNQLPVSTTQAACNIFWSVQGTIAS